MKLQRLTVRNFRIHKEQSVEFDDAFTLIAGPNESGKSTLLDALQAAFFLRARGNSAAHRAIRSEMHAGYPQVEVAFCIGDREFELQKTFSGQSGTARLAERGTEVWHGDAADEKLAELLQASDTSRPEGQWAHLFVAQHRSGDDPAECANAQRARLLRRLKEEGGGVAVVSDLDSAVMNRVDELYQEIFTEGGKHRTNGPYDRARSSKERADAELERARVRWSQLEEAGAVYARAEQDIVEKTAAVKEAEARLAERRAADEKAASLRVREAREQARSDMAAAKLAEWKRRETDIAEARAAIGACVDALEPLLALQKTGEEAFAAADQAFGEADAARREAAATAAGARLDVELADVLVERMGLAQRVAEAEAVLAEIGKIRKERAVLLEEAAKLPRVSEKDLKELRDLERDAHRTVAALKASAAKVRVIAAPSSVTVGDRALGPGDEALLTEDVEVRVGGGFRLAISPGGEAGLAEAKRAADVAASAFGEALRKLSVATLSEAERAYGARSDIERSVKDLDKRIAGSDVEGKERALEEDRAAFAAVERRVAQLRENAVAGGLPASLAEARQIRDAKSAAAQAAEVALRAAEAKRARCEEEKAAAAQQRDKVVEEYRTKCAEKERHEARLAALLGEHGDDEERSAALAEAGREAAAAEAELKATAEALAALGAETIAEDIRRYESALAMHRATLNDAHGRKAGAAALLQQDGSSDPRGEVGRAEAAAARAGEEFAAVKRRTDAIGRLQALFQARRKALAERFTAPLAERIRTYLGRVFGTDLRVEVRVDGEHFAGIVISRGDFGGVPFEFGQLSGGAAEQVAAAVRLAIAELLAGMHGGSLPVVFDDAFTHSDPDRIEGLQSMLYLASQRGLQVVLLSCNATDYSALPAKQITLARWSAGRLSPSGDGPAPDADEGSAGASTVSSESQNAFLDALTAAGGKSGNGALRAALRWDEAHYESVKTALIAAGRIEKGLGRGGSVLLAGTCG